MEQFHIIELRAFARVNTNIQRWEEVLYLSRLDEGEEIPSGESNLF